jgi:hypothetical protein
MREVFGRFEAAISSNGLIVLCDGIIVSRAFMADTYLGEVAYYRTDGAGGILFDKGVYVMDVMKGGVRVFEMPDSMEN